MNAMNKNSRKCLYEVRWHGAGRTLMSRNYCRDRVGVQKYIDDVCRLIKMRNDWTTEIEGNSPEYFETISRKDKAGVSIRRVNKAKEPYNMLEDKFNDLHFLFSVPFRAMLGDRGLKEFARQEQADIENNCKLYSML